MPWNKTHTILLGTFVVGLLSCMSEPSDITPTTNDPSNDPECIDAIAEENFGNFDWIQEHIFTPSCATSTSCHVNVQNMDLREGIAFDEMINVPTTSINNAIRVIPGDPTNSSLLITIDHDSQNGRFSGDLPLIGTMPPNQDLLCLEKRQTIEQWIQLLNE